jgi:hypothetical protein
MIMENIISIRNEFEKAFIELPEASQQTILAIVRLVYNTKIETERVIRNQYGLPAVDNTDESSCSQQEREIERAV